MANKPEELLNDLTKGLGNLAEKDHNFNNGFMRLMGSVFREGALSVKEKELIGIAVCIYVRCEYCIAQHVYKALEAGATPEQIIEAAEVGVAFGGGPSVAYLVTSLMDALNTFAPKFNK
ncbi:carboxymuconolactone decarboxylase family protein [Aceticella autotrophica]|uniref:Carboxymuconolactone decarboxylase family protein n=1 Tax=Aceticella autotrophica TaxID=2755338 RepID=A0A975AWM1_9THEO|nr:carboxymuconolactone decarboxylase family protein [Aceticella autotrophica]QSZ27810.1 carboxymuconolactone decarboxylase family protein [Aceticella autotrophica]